MDCLRDEVISVLRRGEGIPEVTLDVKDDLRILAPTLSVLNDHLPDTLDAESCHVRTALSSGRELYAIFLSGERVRLLGTLEMMEHPPSRWMAGDAIPLAGEGEVFCSPPVTLPLGTMRSLMVRTMDDIVGRRRGILTYRWLLEGSIGMDRVDRAANGPSPYTAALSSVLGIDLFSLHKDPDRDPVPEGTGPGDGLRGFFMGTLPGKDSDGTLVGARSVELAMAMLIEAEGPPSMERIRALSRNVPDDKALFSLLEGSDMDPFFLQKVFKLNKAYYRLEESELDPLFPDTPAVNIISSSRRRGISSARICEMTGLTEEALHEIEVRFGIRPSVEEGTCSNGDIARPLVLSWPEASATLVRPKDKVEAVLPYGRITVSARMIDAYRRDAGPILYAHPDEGTMRSLREVYPDVVLHEATGKN